MKLWGSACEKVRQRSVSTGRVAWTNFKQTWVIVCPFSSFLWPLHSGLGSFCIFCDARNSSAHCLPLGATVAVTRFGRAGKVVMVLFLCIAIMILFFFLNLRLGWTACADGWHTVTDESSRPSGCETFGLKLLSAAKEIAFDLRVGRLFAARVQQPCVTCPCVLPWCSCVVGSFLSCSFGYKSLQASAWSSRFPCRHLCRYRTGSGFCGADSQPQWWQGGPGGPQSASPGLSCAPRLGEVCKGLASQLAKLWNFKALKYRPSRYDMTPQMTT